MPLSQCFLLVAVDVDRIHSILFNLRVADFGAVKLPHLIVSKWIESVRILRVLVFTSQTQKMA